MDGWLRSQKATPKRSERTIEARLLQRWSNSQAVSPAKNRKVMNDPQWKTLLSVIHGETPSTIPTGFIIDSPWLPKWAGNKVLDYFTDDRVFLENNLKAVRTFPQTMFLPGFWSEYGMCTEPSAFGAVSTWEEDEFPFAKRVLHSAAEVERIEKPNPRKDGLLPFVIKRLQHLQPEIGRPVIRSVLRWRAARSISAASSWARPSS